MICTKSLTAYLKKGQRGDLYSLGAVDTQYASFCLSETFCVLK